MITVEVSYQIQIYIEEHDVWVSATEPSGDRNAMSQRMRAMKNGHYRNSLLRLVKITVETVEVVNEVH